MLRNTIITIDLCVLNDEGGYDFRIKIDDDFIEHFDVDVELLDSNLSKLIEGFYKKTIDKK